jgi:hypothetical protein
MLKIEEEFICQQPCGFRSGSQDPMVWVGLANLVLMYRVIEAGLASYAAELRGKTIIRDFQRITGIEM